MIYNLATEFYKIGGEQLGNLFDKENEKIKKQTDELLDTIERYQEVLKKSTIETIQPIRMATQELNNIKDETGRLKEKMEEERKNMDSLMINLKFYKAKEIALYIFCSLLIIFLGFFLYLKYQDSQNMKKYNQNIEKNTEKTADLYQKMYRMMTGEVKNYWDKENGTMYLLDLKEYKQKMKEKKK